MPPTWSLLAKDALYAGTGIRASSIDLAVRANPVLKTGELQVLALARDAAGNHAEPRRAAHSIALTPGGKSELFWRSPEQCILSLAVDAQGNLYAGTSPHGEFRITPDGKGELLARHPIHVVSLAVSGANLRQRRNGRCGLNHRR